MWLLKFLPDWLFYGFAFIGAGGLLLSKFIPQIYRPVAQLVLGVFLLYGIYMVGGIINEQEWRTRVAEMEAKVAAVEAQSADENTKIVTKIKYKKKIVYEKGADIVQYIDREIVKYDVKFAPGGICEIPKEFIEAHNKAAE